MNRKTILVAVCIGLLFSCGKSKERSEFNQAIEDMSNLQKMADEAEEAADDTDKLIKATPIPKETLKALIPNTLNGMKRVRFSVGNQLLPDVNSASATYENEQQEITLDIMDGAGETASAFINLFRLQLAADFENEDENSSERSITLNGLKAVERIEKDSYNNTENSELSTLINNRFLISLKGRAISIAVLKKNFAELDISPLKKFQ